MVLRLSAIFSLPGSPMRSKSPERSSFSKPEEDGSKLLESGHFDMQLPIEKGGGGPRIRFSDRVSVRETISLHDITEKEIKSAWFSGEEFENIRSKCVKQIQMMEEGRPLQDKKYCSRGLEGFTKLGGLQKRGNRSLAINRALFEQEFQRSNDGYHLTANEAIATVYGTASSSSQFWAVRVGLLDQRDAEVYQTIDEMDGVSLKTVSTRRHRSRKRGQASASRKHSPKVPKDTIEETTDFVSMTEEIETPKPRMGKRSAVIDLEATATIFALMDELDDKPLVKNHRRASLMRRFGRNEGMRNIGLLCDEADDHLSKSERSARAA